MAETGVLVGGPDDGRTFPDFAPGPLAAVRCARWLDGDTYYYAASIAGRAYYFHPDAWGAAEALREKAKSA